MPQSPFPGIKVFIDRSVLIALDKRHFLSERIDKRGWIKIVTPGEFLQIFERRYLEGPE